MKRMKGVAANRSFISTAAAGPLVLGENSQPRGILLPGPSMLAGAAFRRQQLTTTGVDLKRIREIKKMEKLWKLRKHT